MRVQKTPAAPDSAAGEFYIRKNNKKADTKECRLYILVEATGFEPTTSWSRTKRATKLRYASIAVYIIPKAAGFCKRFCGAFENVARFCLFYTDQFTVGA